MKALLCSRDAFHQLHFLASHELFYINQNQHALIYGANTCQVLSRKGTTAKLGGITDLGSLQHQYIGYPIHYHPHDSPAYIENHHYRLSVIINAGQTELDAQI